MRNFISQNMNPEQPIVSIITPSFNHGKYLEQTIMSVLSQDYPNIEYLVVDGGSTDNTLEIIQAYSEHIDWWVSEPDNGQAEAINKGFKRARGDIVAWINSDDLYYSREAVSQGVSALLSNPQAGMVYGNGLKITADGRLIDWFRYPQYELKDLLAFKILLQPSVFMRKAALDEAGYLPEESNLLLDHELWIQIAARYPIVHVERFWSIERSHESAKTVSLAAHYGVDAFELIENLQQQEYLKDVIHANYHEIIAGIHVFHGRRLIDAKKPARSIVQFWSAFWKYPPAVTAVWFKVLQAIGGIFGLGETFLSIRDASRRMKNGDRYLTVDQNGVRWVKN